jgi:hypothetical protein
MNGILLCVFVGLIYLFCLFGSVVIIKDLIESYKKDRKIKQKQEKENT